MNDPQMWSYWCDKYGRVEALVEYYPGLLAMNPRLSHAVADIQNAEAAIDAIMAQIVKTAGGDL